MQSSDMSTGHHNSDDTSLLPNDNTDTLRNQNLYVRTYSEPHCTIGLRGSAPTGPLKGPGWTPCVHFTKYKKVYKKHLQKQYKTITNHTSKNFKYPSIQFVPETHAILTVVY